MEEAGLGIRVVAPVVVWSSVPPWRLLAQVMDLAFLGRVSGSEGVGGLRPAKNINDGYRKSGWLFANLP